MFVGMGAWGNSYKLYRIYPTEDRSGKLLKSRFGQIYVVRLGSDELCEARAGAENGAYPSN